MNIQWKRGEFLKFYALMKIRIGGKDDISIQKDDEFDYDGSICKYSGAEFSTPSLRGAIRDDWASLESPDSESNSSIPTFNPARAVAKSVTKNTDLSRVQRTQPMQMETDSLDEETVLQVSDRQSLPKDERGRLTGHLTQADNRRTGMRAPLSPTAGQRALKVTQSDIDQQDHTAISKIRTAANLGKVDIIANPGKARDLELISADAGFGQAGGVKRQASQSVHREGVDIRMNVGRVDPNVQYGDESDGTVVAKVRHTSRNLSAEGVQVSDTSNIRNSNDHSQNGHNGYVAKATTKAPSKPAKPLPKAAAKSVAKPSPKVVAKAVAQPLKTENLPMKIKLARQFDPNFPDTWDFTGKLAERLERVKAHGAKPNFLQALYAAEGDQMRKVLEKEFPSQFA